MNADTTTPPSAARRVSWYALLAAVATIPLAIGAIPWGPRITRDVFYSSPLTAAAGLLALALAAWLIAFARREVGLRWSPMLSAVATFAVIAGLATGLSLYMPLALIGDTQDTGGLIAWLASAITTFLVVQHATRSEHLEALARAVVYGATVVATLALIQRLTGSDPLGLVGSDPSVQWLNGRGTSTLGNPDFLGSFLVGPTVLALGLFLTARLRSSRRYADAVAFALLVIGCIGSLTRGAWIGLAVGLVVLWIAIRADRSTLASAVAMTAVALAIGLATLPVTSGRYESVTDRVTIQTQSVEDDSSTLRTIDQVLGGRLAIWGEAVAITRSRPLLGVGPANYRLGWYPVQGITGLPISGSSLTGDPHSLPLLVSATLGLPALLVLLTAFGLALAPQARETLKGGSGKRLLFSAWWSALAGTLVVSLVGSTTLPFLVWTFVAAGAVGAVRAREAEVDRRIVLPAVAVVLAVVFALTSMSIVMTAAQTRLQRAFDAGDVVALEAAADTAPWSLSIQETRIGAINEVARTALATPGQAGQPTLDATLEYNDAALVRIPLDFELAYQKANLLLAAAQILGEPYASASLEAVDAALELSPVSVSLRTQKAAALLDLGRIDEALAALENFWDRDPTDPLPGSTYVTALALSGRYSEAEAALTTLEREFPDSPAIDEAAANLALLRAP